MKIYALADIWSNEFNNNKDYHKLFGNTKHSVVQGGSAEFSKSANSIGTEHDICADTHENSIEIFEGADKQVARMIKTRITNCLTETPLAELIETGKEKINAIMNGINDNCDYVTYRDNEGEVHIDTMQNFFLNGICDGWKVEVYRTFIIK